MPGIHDRQPSPADRPPVSRVGEQLQQRAGDPSAVAVDSEGADRVEAQAIDDARHQGWDHDLTDVADAGAPPDGTGPVGTDRADGPTAAGEREVAPASVPTDTLDAGDLDTEAGPHGDIGRGAD